MKFLRINCFAKCFVFDFKDGALVEIKSISFLL